MIRCKVLMNSKARIGSRFGMSKDDGMKPRKC